MIIELPPLQPVTYELFGGGHDGGVIVIGPGPPYDPPVSIDLTDRCDDGTLVVHHYDYDGQSGGYVSAEYRLGRC